MHCDVPNTPEAVRSIQRRLLVLAVVAFLLFSVFAYARRHVSSTADAVPSSRVFITAAHIPESEFPECELIYSDADSDVAIYFDTRYVATGVEDGTKVVYEGLTGVIEFSDGNTFYVIPDDPNSTVKGLSGKPVYADGIPIGFVSAMVTGGKLRCVYY